LLCGNWPIFTYQIPNRMPVNNSKVNLLLLLAGLMLSSFQCENRVEEPHDIGFIIFQYDLNNLETSERYNDALDMGIIANADMIKEASGMAACRSNSDLIWMHNDGGNAAHLHVMGKAGENLGHFWVWGTGNRDWEDMCIGPGPTQGVNYIYIGDIGDNRAEHKEIIINRFPEPDMRSWNATAIGNISAENVERLFFQYPDGPRDAEVLMIDPWTKDLYIVTKRTNRSLLYVARYPYQVNQVNQLEKLGEFPFNWALAGDISADGTEIVIKTDRRIYYWKRNPQQSIIEAFKKQPQLLPYFVEPQGESFAWSTDANQYFTLSEQSGTIQPRLYRYTKK
jgi:hypothetical protein